MLAQVMFIQQFLLHWADIGIHSFCVEGHKGQFFQNNGVVALIALFDTMQRIHSQRLIQCNVSIKYSMRLSFPIHSQVCFDNLNPAFLPAFVRTFGL